MVSFKRFTILFILITIGAAMSAAPTGDQILQKTAKLLTSSKSISVKFNLTGNNTTGHGSITMSGKKFTFSAGGISVWYDGHNQWALQQSAGEVNLTIPSQSELLESNPFLIISNYKTSYNVKLLSSDAKFYKVRLTPQAKNNQVKSATITINSKNYQPSSLQLTFADNTKMNVSITSFTTGKTLPVSYFTYNPKAHPDIELIDLR